MSCGTTKLQKCQEVVGPQELQDQGASSRGIPFFFHSSYLQGQLYLSLLHYSWLCSVRTMTAPEAFHFRVLAASGESNQTLVLSPNIAVEKLNW